MIACYYYSFKAVSVSFSSPPIRNMQCLLRPQQHHLHTKQAGHQEKCPGRAPINGQKWHHTVAAMLSGQNHVIHWTTALGCGAIDGTLRNHCEKAGSISSACGRGPAHKFLPRGCRPPVNGLRGRGSWREWHPRIVVWTTRWTMAYDPGK